MPTIGSIERRIQRIEGFKVRLRYPDGRNIRSDQQDFRHNYNYERAASDDITVSQWSRSRFQNVYPGFIVEVLFRDGQIANGNTKLSSVRATY
jgi:Uma2 family endonuclease